MSEVTSDTTTTETARFVGVAVSTYDHDTFTPLPQTVSGVQRVSEILSAHAYQIHVLFEPEESAARAELRRLLAKDCLPTGGSLIVLWSGHGEPAAEDVLHLIGRDTESGSTPEVDSGFIAGLATRTGASQVLLLFDTCYAGTGVMSAATVARRVLQELPPNAERIWIGVVASALDLQPARDGVFLERLTALLKNGPTNPELQLRWSAHSRGVRGDDVIDALIKQWDVSTQQLDAQMSGNAWVMLPNPRYDPYAPEQVVEHLLLAARGGDPGDETSYFSGRVVPLARLVNWVQTARPGIFVVTGPAGSGKSALVGRLVSLSNPTERARLLAGRPVEHADPGERSVHAHVHVRGSTVERLVQEIDDQLIRSGVLSLRPGGPRNRGDLLGELERSPVKPVIVIDGLDEAASEAWQISSQVLSLLAGNACIIIATRDLVPIEDGPGLVETLAPQNLIDLDDAASRRDATGVSREYVAKRLANVVTGTMDTAAVAAAIIRLAREEGEGLFLLARVITSQLRAEPLDTSQPGWEAALSRSVEAAFTRDIERIPPLRRDDIDLPAAARELLTALAWSYGAGLPTDVWAVIAIALSATRTRYDRDAVYWLLGHAGRYIVEDGEGDHAVYRLSHQRLVEHLHPRPTPSVFDAAQQHAAPVATALIDHYLDLLASGLAPELSTYLWRYVWRHCADAGSAGIDALRQLAATNPAFLNDLAMSLNNLGNHYSELGRRHDAVAPTEEAVTIYRQLAATNPAFLNDLAMSLNNLGNHYSELGRRHDAVAPTEEAVTIRRQLATTNPAFLNNLASSLNNLGIHYSELGRRHDAVAPTEEAVTIYRQLAATNPAFLNDLAMSLNNLGIRYSELGRRHDAVAPTEEAVTIYRQLAATNPAFLNDLASSLNNLGIRYSELGRRHDAVAPTEEAVTIYRQLATTNPAFLNDLASSLNNLGIHYSELGRRHDAVAPTEEAVTIYRQLAATNPAFLNNLAMSLNNLGIRYSELGRRHAADLVWDDTFHQFADQPVGFAFLASHRALARPAYELPMACTDLYSSLSCTDLPTSSTVEVRRACRELRQRNPSDFDTTWRDLAGELPAWLLIDPELLQSMLEWISMPTWQASCDYLREHVDTLLSDAVQPVFDELELETPDNPTLQQHRTLLGAAQQHGIDVAYSVLLVREVVNAWISTDTWAASQAFLDEHHADLASEEAVAILADCAADGQSVAIIHHALLTLMRLGQADRAYNAIMDSTQLQAELAAARGDADPTRLIAYATIGVATASADADTAQACFHLALGHALTDDPATDPDLVVRAKRLAPDQVPVWLGYIGVLLGARPDRHATLIPLSQTLLAPPPAD